MKDKKRFIIFLMVALVSVALVLTALFVPVVHLVAKDNNQNIVFDGTVNIVDYTKKAVFLNTDAFDVYFDASGPIWIAATAVMLNFLVVVAGIVAFFAAIFELATSRLDLVSKQNTLAKKLAIFSGIVGTFVFVVNIVSFLITTAMANGFVEFYPALECFLGLAFSVVLVVLGLLCGKKQYPQKSNKLRDSLGFLFSVLFVSLAIVLLFVPQFNEYFMYGKPISFWTLGKQATIIPNKELPIGGDYALGIFQWSMMAAMVPAAFVLVYSTIGFVLSLCGKNANWLAKRIKRWSLAFLVLYLVLYILMLASVSVISTSLFLNEKISVMLPIAYFAVFAPFLPVVSSSIVASNKKDR